MPLHFALLLLVVVVFPAVALAGDVFNDDVLGLIVFKAGLRDPRSKLSSWSDSDDTPCRWNGVVCDPYSGRVTAVTLDGFSLSGEISRSLLRLQFLQNLSLANNNFTGNINPNFSNLWALQSLDFSGNNLSGSIPAELFNQCGSLKSVNFAENAISGELPESLSSCMSLESINFSSNQITGRLPAKIWSLTGLQLLDLSNNLFSGEIPRGFGNMYSLKAVNLRNNGFSGVLPEDIGSCSQLESINFGQNSISGFLPESLKKLNSCSSLSLNGNLLKGELPRWISQLQSLENLDLSGNGISGEIPDSLGSLESLRALNLSSNKFTGNPPESLKKSLNLISIDLSRNLLAGDLPEFFFDMGLHSLSLSGNKFSGSIPNLETTTTIEVLDLSMNLLSGAIPSGIEGCRNLMVMNLSGNQLIGEIPPAIGGLKMLQVVDLSKNRLNGSIPLQTGKCSALNTLALKQNNLTGPIPATLANLTDLRIVDLSRNNLSGALPKELKDLSQLRSFNVSDNHLNGELPDSSFFNAIPLSSLSGNPSLCGSVVNQSCPAVHPKPIVLNPNSSAGSADGSSAPNPRKKKLMLSISTLVAIGAAAFIFLGVIAITILNIRVRRSSSPPVAFSARDDLSQSPGSQSEYGKLVMFSGEADFGEGAHALLSKDKEIGRGGFGTVYHTVLRDGRSVAIKKLSITGLIKSQDEFETEVKKLGRAKNPNLVALQGYYSTPSLQLLINEYVSGGSLFKRLHDRDETTLSWHQRFNIIIGIAKGLAHLHQMGITHYNLKSTNILLDASGEPKVGDFGLAKLLPVLDRYILSSKIQSALGYMAPEFACRTVRITEKCDVYGFGILALEIVTGRRPVEYMEDDVVVLCDMVRGALDEGKAEDCVDGRLCGNFLADEVVPVMKLGLICASQVPSNRPEMAEVVNILELVGCPAGGRRED